MAPGPVLSRPSVVEDCFEAAFEDLVRAGWPTGAEESGSVRAAHEELWGDLASGVLMSDEVVEDALSSETLPLAAPASEALSSETHGSGVLPSEALSADVLPSSALVTGGAPCAHASPSDGGVHAAPKVTTDAADHDGSGADRDDADTNRDGAGSGSGVPLGLLAQLDSLEATVAAIASVDPATLPGSVAAEVSHRLHAATERLAGQRLGCIGRVEAEDSWAVETMHSFTTWLATAEGLSDALAKRTVGAARALREHLPATAAAVRAGTITGEHVATMVKATATQALREALAGAAPSDAAPSDAVPSGAPADGTATDDAAADGDLAGGLSGDVVGCTWEERLLERSGWRFKEFNQLVKGFTIAADPVAQEKEFKDASEREFLLFSPTLGGSQITGFVTTEHAQVLITALRAVAGVPDVDALVPADLRRIDALLDLSQMFLDGGIAGKGANVRPHLSVHITWDEFTRLYDNTTTDTETGTHSPGWSPQDLEARLAAGYATWEDGTGPIPDAVLRRIACDGEVTRIIFGPDSQILNISRTKRTFTKEHRRAIIARDRTCVWPDCNAPPHVCEIHHAIRHWADNGETTPSNGALLCRHHHHRVDGENIAMTYTDRWTIHTPGSYQADSHQGGE